MAAHLKFTYYSFVQENSTDVRQHNVGIFQSSNNVKWGLSYVNSVCQLEQYQWHRKALKKKVTSSPFKNTPPQQKTLKPQRPN